MNGAYIPSSIAKEPKGLQNCHYPEQCWDLGVGQAISVAQISSNVLLYNFSAGLDIPYVDPGGFGCVFFF